MNVDKKPKVFISYSWVVKDWTVLLATRLINDGVDVKVDFWDLKEGQDKYKFMESMVSDETIDFVLILCDETYSKKANERSGGVGDETVIISSELYGKSSQVKFIPLVLSKDAEDKAIVPIYIKSRIYFDFSDAENYENEYERLLRHIYNQPLIPKPKIGKMPEWLKDNQANLSYISSCISVMKSSSNEARKNATIWEFNQKFSNTAREYNIDETRDFGQEIVKKINAMKPLRDLYLDFLKEVLSSGKGIADFVCIFFERVYNDLMLLPSNKGSWYPAAYDHYRFLIWEMFVCTIAYLRHYEKFEEIHSVLTHTYFLQDELSPSRKLAPSSFAKFRCHSETLENYGANKHLHSFTADIAVQRGKEPVISKDTFAETDVFICQMSFALGLNENGYHWFPLSYCYASQGNPSWIKLTSREYCEKIYPLFGVKSLEELKRKIQEKAVTSEYRHSGSWRSVPRIPLKFDNLEIGSLP